MTEQDIIDNKPEGANLFLRSVNSVYYYKLHGGYLYFWNFDQWSITYREGLKLEPI